MVPSVSQPKKNKNPNLKHRPKNPTNVDMTCGIINKADRYIYKDTKRPIEDPIESKIIFLGKDNLEKLRGYKAFLELWENGELCLTITGHSVGSAIALFDSIEKMKDEEIHGE